MSFLILTFTILPFFGPLRLGGCATITGYALSLPTLLLVGAYGTRLARPAGTVIEGARATGRAAIGDHTQTIRTVVILEELERIQVRHAEVI